MSRKQKGHPKVPFPARSADRCREILDRNAARYTNIEVAALIEVGLGSESQSASCLLSDWKRTRFGPE